MNRKQKVEFIESQYPELYKLLEANAFEYLEDVWNADIDNITNYNNWVAFYCGQICNADLMSKLLV